MAVTITAVSPVSHSGPDPITVTLTGTEFPTDVDACKVRVGVQGSSEWITESAPVTATDVTSVTGDVTFPPGTSSGQYTVGLVTAEFGWTRGVPFVYSEQLPPTPGPGEVNVLLIPNGVSVSVAEPLPYRLVNPLGDGRVFDRAQESVEGQWVYRRN